MINDTITINGTPVNFTTSGHTEWTDVKVENDGTTYRIHLSKQKVVQLIEEQLNVSQVKNTLRAIAE